ncbi:hypothetical protein [Bradyrhizobium sp. STM 3562]|uniref:hypothetical protein n=1 Tax=Bradyrhizobium sp. STM 3562 TaxID=578924 RepID=UPI00389029A5
MSALILYVVVGLIAGALFRVQTLVVLAALVFCEDLVSFILSGSSDGLVRLPTSQCALQTGYGGGLYLRSVLERAGLLPLTHVHDRKAAIPGEDEITSDAIG